MLTVPWRRAEPAEEAEVEDEMEWEREGVGAVSYAPLLWTKAAPNLPEARWFYVRRPGQAEFEPIKVLPGFEYPSGFEYAGPLPEPYEVKARW